MWPETVGKFILLTALLNAFWSGICFIKDRSEMNVFKATAIVCFSGTYMQGNEVEQLTLTGDKPKQLAFCVCNK